MRRFTFLGLPTCALALCSLATMMESSEANGRLFRRSACPPICAPLASEIKPVLGQGDCISVPLPSENKPVHGLASCICPVYEINFGYISYYYAVDCNSLYPYGFYGSPGQVTDCHDAPCNVYCVPNGSSLVSRDSPHHKWLKAEFAHLKKKRPNDEMPDIANSGSFGGKVTLEDPTYVELKINNRSIYLRLQKAHYYRTSKEPSPYDTSYIGWEVSANQPSTPMNVVSLQRLHGQIFQLRLEQDSWKVVLHKDTDIPTMP